ncbi:hypothetical protein ILYODFUR_033296 [Ilyodon furcidens]|uniref:Uncharacterized protein n=1 Tax=Ilyodon furcidens TaxID=33524 RepID=A0ABV0SRA5_9TELE
MSPECCHCTAQGCLHLLHMPQRTAEGRCLGSSHRGPGDTSVPVQATEGPGDASAPAHATAGLGDAPAPAHATEGPGDASAPAQVSEGLDDASAPVCATEGLDNPLAPTPGLKAFQGFKEGLVLILATDLRGEGFEEEAPPDPVSEEFKEHVILVLASMGLPGSVPVSEGPVGSVLVCEGPSGSVPVSEGPSGSVPVSGGLPGTASASEGSPGTVKAKPDSKPPEFHRVSGGSSTLHGRPLICHPDAPLLCSGSLVFAFAAGRQGLYVCIGLHVSAAHRKGLHVSAGLQVLVLTFIPTVGLHVFADVAGRPGS